MITVYTLLMLLKTNVGVTQHEALFLSKEDCVKAEKVLYEKFQYSYNIHSICYESNRVDVK